MDADGPRATYPAPVGKTLRCWIGWHDWVNRRADDGMGFRLCRRCGKDQDPGSWQWQRR